MKHAKKSLPVWPWPINDKGSTFDRIPGNKAPEPAVIAMVPIVAHHEVMFFRDNDRAEFIVARISPPLFLIHVETVIVFKSLPVDQNLPAVNLYSVSGQADDTFDEVFTWIHRVNKNDNIFAFGLANGDNSGSNKGYGS